jgi:hypothetical protein
MDEAGSAVNRSTNKKSPALFYITGAGLFFQDIFLVI